jgi:hypothetical protein
MMEMVTVEELDIRLRIVESEIAGEKLVSRHVLTQAQHNADDIAEIRTQYRHLANDMALVKAAQVAQGGTLNILVQDVREMRTEIAAVRQEAATRHDELRGEMATRHDELRSEMEGLRGETATRHDELRGEMEGLRGEMATRHEQLLGAIRALGSGGSAPAV